MVMVIVGEDVNETFEEAAQKIREWGVREESRNGPVLVAPFPVMTTTYEPTQRVHTNKSRDANPFFHLMECLWMLSGSNDATWLDRFVKNFSSRYGEHGGIMHGAYGHRWREHFGQDQLAEAISMLRADPTTRRVVIAMWDPRSDLGNDQSIRDFPCNTHMYPRVHNGRLDLTVCCRSNDIVWGAYGANAVHFSFVQEYMALSLGLEVGTLYQLSNTWHGYLETLDKMEDASNDYLYIDEKIEAMPIGDPAFMSMWLADLALFMYEPLGFHDFKNSWFAEVAQPVYLAHTYWRDGDRDEAIEYAAANIKASDWRYACLQWMKKRHAPE